MLAEIVDDEAGLISLYYGEGISEEEAEGLREKVEGIYPDIDIEMQYGGQPVYYYILSVE